MAEQLHPFAIGQLWRRREEPRKVYTVYRVDADDHDIAVCHEAFEHPDQVHPFDVVLISATTSGLSKWELAEWKGL